VPFCLGFHYLRSGVSRWSVRVKALAQGLARLIGSKFSPQISASLATVSGQIPQAVVTGLSRRLHQFRAPLDFLQTFDFPPSPSATILTDHHHSRKLESRCEYLPIFHLSLKTPASIILIWLVAANLRTRRWQGRGRRAAPSHNTDTNFGLMHRHQYPDAGSIAL
jgi:hypothetical protein